MIFELIAWTLNKIHLNYSHNASLHSGVCVPTVYTLCTLENLILDQGGVTLQRTSCTCTCSISRNTPSRLMQRSKSGGKVDWLTDNFHIGFQSGLLTGCAGAGRHNLIKAAQSRTISENPRNSAQYGKIWLKI